MKTSELCKALRTIKSPFTGMAADRLEELEKELADERYRHDRYVDFELAEAKELAELKEKLQNARAAGEN